MAKVIIRHGHTVDGDGRISYDDREATFEEADALVGVRLDRRRNYAIIGENVCISVSFSQVCSGCSSDDPTADFGAGCRECGYTGRRIQSHWVPLPIPEEVE